MNVPVLLLTFNRLDCVQKLFSILAEVKPTKLYIASDGPRVGKCEELEQIKEVRTWMMQNITWECTVATRFLLENSGGCKFGVSGAISWFFGNEENGIILEDDCIPNLSFFPFCEQLLERYKNDQEVFSIVGYNPAGKIDSPYSYEFASISHCWGWATWKDRWEKFKLDFSPSEVGLTQNFSSRTEIQKYWESIFFDVSSNKVNSWFYPWNFCIAQNKGLTIYPTKNLVSNIGEAGEHYNGENPHLNLPTFGLQLTDALPTKSPEKMNDILWKYFFNGAPKQIRKRAEKSNTTLSIITICYNEKYIEQTCKSIVEQTWQNFEWIVVDGGSTDGTLEILKEYQASIDILISEPDKGIYNAMNKGIKAAHGEWLNFMNGGDSYYDREVLQKIFSGLGYNADVLYGWQYMVHCKELRNVIGTIDKQLLVHTAIGHQACFYKSILFQKNGMYNENNKISSDSEKNIEILINGGKFYHLPFEVANFNDIGISSNPRYKHLLKQERLAMLRKYFSREEILKWGRDDEKIYFVDPIINITSYPARITDIHCTIETLLNQSVRPQKIVLWLGEEKFPQREKDLPDSLLTLQSDLFEIRWTHDIRAFTKLIPSLKAFPENVLVTADDDILYPQDWLEKLLLSYVKNPDVIHAHRPHVITFTQDTINPYSEWHAQVNQEEPSYNLFLTGVGGVLYPPHVFPDEVFKEEVFKKLTPLNDDIWFWAMAVLNGTKINWIKDGQEQLDYIPGSREKETCLWKTNVNEGANDRQMTAVLEYYPQILPCLKKIQGITSTDTQSEVSPTDAVTSELKEKTYYLFKTIPLVSKKFEGETKDIKLFSTIPVYTRKKVGREKKIYILGLPYSTYSENETCQIKRTFFKTTKSIKKADNSKLIQLCGIPLYSRKMQGDKKRISFLGLPVYSHRKTESGEEQRLIFFKYRKTQL